MQRAFLSRGGRGGGRGPGERRGRKTRGTGRRGRKRRQEAKLRYFLAKRARRPRPHGGADTRRHCPCAGGPAAAVTCMWPPARRAPQRPPPPSLLSARGGWGGRVPAALSSTLGCDSRRGEGGRPRRFFCVSPHDRQAGSPAGLGPSACGGQAWGRRGPPPGTETLRVPRERVRLSRRARRAGKLSLAVGPPLLLSPGRRGGAGTSPVLARQPVPYVNSREHPPAGTRGRSRVTMRVMCM